MNISNSSYQSNLETIESLLASLDSLAITAKNSEQPNQESIESLLKSLESLKKREVNELPAVKSVKRESAEMNLVDESVALEIRECKTPAYSDNLATRKELLLTATMLKSAMLIITKILSVIEKGTPEIKPDPTVRPSEYSSPFRLDVWGSIKNNTVQAVRNAAATVVAIPGSVATTVTSLPGTAVNTVASYWSTPAIPTTKD